MRLYRLLLHLYPASFRAEYGRDMLAIFARRRREAAGTAAVAALWADAIADTLVNALRAHADILRQDLSHAARALARTPGFTAAAILVAALGIGATTTTFSLVDHVLVRPLPFPGADRLVKLYHDQSFRGYSRLELSPATFADLKQLNRSFDGMAAYHSQSVSLTGQGDALRLDGVAVTTDLFQLLGAQAAIGRVFTSADERPDAPDAVILNYDLWTTAFGGDPGVLGRSIVLDNVPYVVVGVMPRTFRFPQRTTDFWMSRRWKPADFEQRDNFYIYGVGRLKPDVSLEQARAELNTIMADIARRYPRELARTGATVVRLRDEVTWQAREMLLALAGAALCMLLIACSNLASLLMSRALARRRELAVRAALGAGRERLVRQAVTESLLLAALGGIAGVLIAMVAMPLVARLVPTALPIGDAPSLDWRLLALAASITIATGLGFGIVPGLKLTQHAGFDALRDGARSSGSRRTERLRAALVVAEVAASVVLLVAAGLLIRALWQVQAVDPGFRSDGVLTVQTWLPMPQYEAVARREQLYRRVLDEVRAQPGVQHAAYISFLPMVMRGGIWEISVPEQPALPGEARMASLRFITPGFFDALGIPIRQGRDVAESDGQNSQYVAVVSESFARTYWPGESALGRHFTVRSADRVIVGVVGDIHVRGLERESEPQVYLPSPQINDGGSVFYAPKELVIKSSGDPAALTAAVREIVRRADPEIPISRVQTLASIVNGETTPRRVQLTVLVTFAGVAVLLAAVGIHGLLAFAVSARTRELGVRLALGAEPHRLLARVLGRGVLLAVAGLAIGMPIALGAARVMQALLAGVSPADPAAAIVAAGTSLLTTLAGSLAPALRVLRIDPVTAIRDE